MNYYRSQIGRIQAEPFSYTDRYALKVQRRDDSGPDRAETHWLSLNSDQLQRIGEILAEGDE